MVDLSAVSSVLSSLKAAGDMAGALIELKVSSEVQGTVIKLNHAILEAQRQSMQALEEGHAQRRRIEELEAEIKRLGDQSAAIAKLKRRSPFYFAEGDSDPFCPRCVEEFKLLVHMQKAGATHPSGRQQWRCPSCRTDSIG